ncbi:uncharacterized protein LOC112592702 [Melanaphis sacchari]|uniref:uncharacterized protein LOC112592702 n=1 Tax=Melanaphis sacchari TaxID=742174 RepID=UPI000DC13BBF|nr:uncharacterized protein LOC112592702 [Melanaphis sacchari]
MDNDARELRRLNRQKERIQASVQLIKKYVEKFDPSSQSIKQIQIRLDKLITHINAFDEIHNELLNCEEATDNIDEQLKFVDETCTLRADMEDLISKFSAPEVDNSLRVSHSSASDAIRLPTIQPPTFSGHLEDWSSFFDTFNALFHNNVSLTDVQRLHYLKSSVLGPAADIIKNFTITADNYKVAYEELVRHYENKGFTIQSHIRSLLQTPKITIASASELRKLHHHVASHVRALRALGQPVMHWDAWLVTLICGQLDSSTAGEWQLRQDSKDLPTYEQIETFLAKRIFAFEAGAVTSVGAPEKQHHVKTPQNNNKFLPTRQNHNNKVFFTRSAEDKVLKCPVCTQPHKIYSCNTFLKMSIADRKNAVAVAKLCYNCLNYGHQIKDCRLSSCPKCNKRHNSKLHEDTPPNHTLNEPNCTESTMVGSTPSSVLFSGTTNNVQSSDVNFNIMLSTSIIKVQDQAGNWHNCRAISDSGSQLNFITHECAKKLKLQSYDNTQQPITGIGSISSSATQSFSASISSRFCEHHLTAVLHSLPTIVNVLPSHRIQQSNLILPRHIKDKLADPNFYEPNSIDILLGSEIFFDILGNEKWPLTESASLRGTDFGWIVVGKLPIEFNQVEHTPPSIATNSSLSLFTSVAAQQTVDEKKAEAHFLSTISRDENGRFVVRLPFAQNPQSLGDSRSTAQRRFLNLEKRFAKEPGLADEYNAFMTEYLNMDHMEIATTTVNPCYYLPHHAVLKSNSTTTKLRVVFDGSSASKSGLSLNDILLKGPKSQPDIISILLRFRVHNIALTADVEKMYRQVRMAAEDCDFQRICYRANPHDQLTEYKLKTVTYGTKSASFLATRCLTKIADEVDDVSIKRIISQDFYVDDLISGGESIEAVHQIYNQLHSTLMQYGFPLRKWCSSARELFDLIPQQQSDSNFFINMSEDDTIGTLGLLWQPASDSFLFMVKQWCPQARMTKRTLLSDISKVFDPIGLVSPVLIRGKIFLQQLWSLKISWDELLSEDLSNRWIKFYTSLQCLNQVVVPRKAMISTSSNIQLHAFSDASQEAFGACVYMRSMKCDGSMEVHLYTSKSRVAPMKPSTIPRLELCGALLAAELANDTLAELKALNIIVAPSNVYLWSDSSIVIAWLQSKSLFSAYISNRLARILDVSSPNQWHHVPTKENPADLISRGIDAASIAQSKLWWHGPHWLIQSQSTWPNSYQSPDTLPELRTVKLVLTASDGSSPWLLEKYSSWSKLLRVTALVQRFINNCKLSHLKNREKCTIGFLSITETAQAERLWVGKAQVNAFEDELSRLKANKMVRRSSALIRLSPFIDKHGLIRVGGRLMNASISHDSKYPILLPSKSIVTKLIFNYEHRRLMHAGPQALLAHVSHKYWPLRGREIARKTVHHCIQCFRTKPTFSSPLMAPLPRERVTISRAFSKTGVDYCGPIMVRSGLRKVTPIKTYICVFVCMVTRAIHLELVSSLAAEDFLATLSRFMARRGQVSVLYSDNGTNFVGANRILQSQFKAHVKDKSVNNFLNSNAIQWKFIPPAAPHFGGLWEASVQSAKRHLYRVSKGILLTYDETTTLLCKVEAALNSRPLTPMSLEPSDLSVLTPGHFLVGGPLMLPPEPDNSTVPKNRLRRFNLMQAQFQLFWKRWLSEYLPQCQRKGKWLKRTRNAVVGDIAILKNELLPPLQWPLVRITEIHPGQDGIVRAVTVRNSAGQSFIRPVVKLAFLPTSEDEDQDTTS